MQDYYAMITAINSNVELAARPACFNAVIRIANREIAAIGRNSISFDPLSERIMITIFDYALSAERYRSAALAKLAE